jgi:TolB-like protein
MTSILSMNVRRLVAGALAGFGAALATTPLLAQGAAPAEPKAVVAVMQFDITAMTKQDEFAPLDVGVQVLLAEALAMNGRVRVVEREKIQAILAEQNLVTAGRIDPATASKIGKILGAQYMLFGLVFVDPKMEVRLSVRAIDTETSAYVYNEGVKGKGDNVFKLIDELAAKVNVGLKLPGKREVEKSKDLGVNGPNQFAAMKAMSAARRLEEQGDIQGAIVQYQKSLALNADLGVVRTRLAMLEKKPR